VQTVYIYKINVNDDVWAYKKFTLTVSRSAVK